jgi:hypothetical protein
MFGKQFHHYYSGAISNVSSPVISSIIATAWLAA